MQKNTLELRVALVRLAITVSFTLNRPEQLFDLGVREKFPLQRAQDNTFLNSSSSRFSGVFPLALCSLVVLVLFTSILELLLHN
jgi:hypothetical protein